MKQKNFKRIIMVLLPVLLLSLLSGCGNNEKKKADDKAKTEQTTVAKKAKYKKGEEVTLEADHMEGMKGAKATIQEAKYTKYYEVNYRDTETGKEIKNHKWVVEDEIKGEPKDLKVGDKVTLEADHMKGMKGAKATIVAVHEGYVYAVNYHPTNDPNKEIKNHKWVVEDEITKA